MPCYGAGVWQAGDLSLSRLALTISSQELDQQAISSQELDQQAIDLFRGLLIALDTHIGKTVWKVDQTAINSLVFGSWSTPVILRAGGHDELIKPLPGERIGSDGEFRAYDPATGKEQWRCKGLGSEVYAMPAVSAAADIVVGISGHNGPRCTRRRTGNPWKC